jgi:hypothetical protein
MFKWFEICTVDYGNDMIATVIFVEFMVHFWYMFIKSPRHLNKLRNASKEII